MYILFPVQSNYILCILIYICLMFSGTFQKTDDLLEFAKLGCYCEYDLFGIEQSHYQLNADVDMPSDAQRIDRIGTLIGEGYGDKITIGHDIHTKHRLVCREELVCSTGFFIIMIWKKIKL